MKKFLWVLLLLLVLGLCGCTAEGGEQVESAVAEKPVIYLCPEAETEVTVTLQYAGTLLSAYPEYDGSWTVTAAPDGTLTDAAGRQYNYLFWEGVSETSYDFRRGFVVPGGETREFLEEKLRYLGLSDTEAADFITYWLPRMQNNPYNLIAFQGRSYEEEAKLTVTPQPDSLIRVFMAYEPLEEPLEVPEQELPSHSRTGFTVVEWGGAEVARAG